MSEISDRVSRAVLEYIFEKTGTMVCNLDVGEVAVKAMQAKPRYRVKMGKQLLNSAGLKLYEPDRISVPWRYEKPKLVAA